VADESRRSALLRQGLRYDLAGEKKTIFVLDDDPSMLKEVGAIWVARFT
jgi:hypothetical protein